MKNNIVTIAFAFNNDYAHPAAAALTSLLKTRAENTFYEIVIVHSDELSAGTIDIFEDYYRRNFAGFSFKWISFDKERVAQFPVKGISPETYFRLFLGELLPNREKVLWADSDLIFKKDISEFFKIDISSYDVALTRDIINEKKHCVVHAYYPEIKSAYLYTTCFMLLNLRRWREQQLTTRFSLIVNEYREKIRLCDLDVLNLSQLKITELPFRTCVLVGYLNGLYDHTTPWVPYDRIEIEEGQRDPSVIHYAGLESPKPWREKDPFRRHYMPWVDAVRQSPYASEYSRSRECSRRLKRFWRYTLLRKQR